MLIRSRDVSHRNIEPAMSEESKLADAELNKEVISQADSDRSNDEAHEEADGPGAPSPGDDGTGAKKKKSKRAKMKKALGRHDGSKAEAESSSDQSNKLTAGMVDQVLEMNPSLKSEVAGLDKEKAAEKLKSLDVASLLTGMVCLPHPIRRFG